MDRLNRIAFDDETHKYWFDGVMSKISTNGMIGRFFPEFDADAVLSRWIYDDSGRFISKHTGEVDERYLGLTISEIKELWRVNGERESGKGTVLHEMIEFGDDYKFDTYGELLTYCNERIPEGTTQETASRDQHLSHHKIPLITLTKWRAIAEHLHPNERIGWQNYLDFAASHELEPFMAEAKLHSDEGVSGMVDMLYKLGDKVVVCDWKRSMNLCKGAYGKMGKGPCSYLPASTLNKYRLQISIYSWMLEKYYGMQVAYGLIVGLHPSRPFQSFKVEPHDYFDTVQRMFDCQVVTVYTSARDGIETLVDDGVQSHATQIIERLKRREIDFTELCAPGFKVNAHQVCAPCVGNWPITVRILE